ncbi:nucleotide-binding domain-containing protein [Flavobacterium sp. LB2R40]|uniref:nucleotide-binding domain-containing protein n=1 Tax=Flavobacterium sp. LB2R40 TaxID=3401722 RepID=UPI003AAB781F
MKLFENYLTDFDNILSKKVRVTPEYIKEQRTFSSNLLKAQNHSNENYIGLGMPYLPAPIQGPKVLFKYDKSFLTKHFGNNNDAFDKITIGPHPDFSNLQSSDYINHHCVSVFVDIKGSTRLIEKYSLLEVRLIKDSLLTLAIEIANQFGGHIHRLQGDGIFIQFVRKDKTPNDAAINALNAISILTQFVSVDLANIMKQYDLKPIKIRAGIDYGDNDNVLWSYYGIAGCEELTTTSLHTDMAAKLQAKAYDNSILIGGNVKKLLDLKSDFYSYFENQESKEKVYSISSQFTYPFFVLNWREYLTSLPFVWKTSASDILEIKEKPITIECYLTDENGTSKERYYPNSKSIPKEKKIIFNLLRDNRPFVMHNFESIEWYARNSGKQAEDMQHLNLDFEKHFNNKTICTVDAAYLGHHYIECKILRGHLPTEKVTFPIFVQ